MRPAMMLFLRALVILGAVVAVVSCGFAQTLSPEDTSGAAGISDDPCTRMTLSNRWATVPAAGSTVSASPGAGQCL